MTFFAFSIKLIWLGVGFLNSIGAEIGYKEKVSKKIGNYYFLKNPKDTASSGCSHSWHFVSFMAFGGFFHKENYNSAPVYFLKFTQIKIIDMYYYSL